MMTRHCAKSELCQLSRKQKSGLISLPFFQEIFFCEIIRGSCGIFFRALFDSVLDLSVFWRKTQITSKWWLFWHFLNHLWLFFTDAPRERPKLQLAKRTAPVESSDSENKSSSIFGAAKPVDTAAKEREIEEKLQKQQSSDKPKNQDSRSRTTSERSSDAGSEPAPSRGGGGSASIFGQARPVDTTQREREIEEKLKKTDINSENSSKSSQPRNKSYDDNRDYNRKAGSGKTSPDNDMASEKRSRSPPPMKKAEEDKPPVIT